MVARITVACQILRWQLEVTYHEVRAHLGVDDTLENVVVSEHQAPEQEVTGNGRMVAPL